MNLRPYQSEMVAAIRAAWAAGQHRVLGCLPTGGGKTEVAIDIIRTDATPAKRALVLVERKVLCHQWAARLRRHGIDRVGILQGENTTAVSAPVLVATAQTVRSRGVPEGVALIVIDESHIWHTAHDDVLQASPDAHVLGLTATPLREGLGLRFDKLVIGATIRQLIDAGHLVRPRYFAPAAETIAAALERVHVRAGDYASDELGAAMRNKAIIGDAVASWRVRGEDRQSIAFCVDKQHARDLASEFVVEGVAAEVVVDDTDDDARARIFAAFDRREVRVLCSVGVLAVGFDSPVASCAILARPTLSTALHIQQGGRVLRPYPGKADALILDHAANTLRHGRLEDFAPPAELSQIDRAADKRSRKAPAEAWVCRHCEAVNPIAEDICGECGEPRRRQTAVVILDGALQEVEVHAGVDLPGPTPDQVRQFYLMTRWHAEAKGLKPGWAYFATLRRFGFDGAQGKRWVSYGWRDLPAVAPDAECGRWLRADLQRNMIVRRHGGRAYA